MNVGSGSKYDEEENDLGFYSDMLPTVLGQLVKVKCGRTGDSKKTMCALV